MNKTMNIQKLNGKFEIKTIFQNNGWCSINLYGMPERVTGNLNVSLNRGQTYLFQDGIPFFVNSDDAYRHCKEIVINSTASGDIAEDIFKILKLVKSMVERMDTLGISDVKVLTIITRNILNNYKDKNIENFLEDKECNLIFKRTMFGVDKYHFLFPKVVVPSLNKKLQVQAAILDTYNYFTNLSMEKNTLYFNKLDFYKQCLLNASTNYNLSKQYVDEYFKQWGTFFNFNDNDVSCYNYKEIEEKIFQFVKSRPKFKVSEHTDGKLDDITLTQGQTNVVNSIVSAPWGSFQICSGGPGTGKTTSIAHALNIAAEQLAATNSKAKYDVLCIAPTGAAKSVMEDMFGNFNSCNIITRTIHSYIFDPVLIDETFDYIIIDEASMVDSALFYTLLQISNFTDSRVIFMGDPKQLPSIGFGALLRDFINIGTLQHIHLTEVKRQAEGSNLLKFIERFGAELQDDETVYTREKEIMELLNNSDDLDFTAKNFIYNDKEMEDYLLQANVLTDLANSQIIAPTNKTLQTINNFAQRYLTNNNVEVYKRGFKKFNIGDKVVFLKNTKGEVQNGTIGFIIGGDSIGLEVELSDGKVVRALINPENKDVEIEDDDYNFQLTDYPCVNDMVLGYCVTVHKGQGGTWENILYIQGTNGYNMVSNELLYTAFSRASSKLTILADSGILNKAVENREILLRNTYLEEMIK